jgi:hypothetical protein
VAEEVTRQILMVKLEVLVAGQEQKDPQAVLRVPAQLDKVIVVE